MKAGLKVLQVFIGILFLTTSAGKLLDIRGFAEVLFTYDWPGGSVTVFWIP